MGFSARDLFVFTALWIGGVTLTPVEKGKGGASRYVLHVHKCSGDSVDLAWFFPLSPNERVESIRWSFAPGQSGPRSLLAAMDARGTFTARDNRVLHQGGPSIRLTDLRVQDTGTYAVRFVTDSNIRNGSIDVYVTEPPEVTGSRLTLKQDGGAVADETTGQWYLSLRCGHFASYGQPVVVPVLEMPSGESLRFPQRANGSYVYRVPTTAESGLYRCSILSPNSTCLKAKVAPAVTKVDMTRVRPALLEATLRDLEQQRKDLQVKDTDEKSLADERHQVNEQGEKGKKTKQLGLRIGVQEKTMREGDEATEQPWKRVEQGEKMGEQGKSTEEQGKIIEEEEWKTGQQKKRVQEQGKNMEGQGKRIKGQGKKTEDQEKKTAQQEERTEEQREKMEEQTKAVSEEQIRNKEHGLETEEQGNLTEEHGKTTEEQGKKTEQQGGKTEEQEREIDEQGKRIREQGKTTAEQKKNQGEKGKQIEELGKRIEELGEKLEEQGKKIEELGQKTEEQGKKIEEQGKKIEEQLKRIGEHGKKLEEQGKKIEEQGKKIGEQGKKLEEQGKKIEEQGKMTEEQGKRLEEQRKEIEEQAKTKEEQGKRMDELRQRLEEQRKRNGEKYRKQEDQVDVLLTLDSRGGRRKREAAGDLEKNTESDLQALKKAQKALESKFEKATQTVGFHARFTQISQNLLFQAGDRLRFDKVLYNKGNGYSVDRLGFLTPITGQYVIFASVVASPDSWRKINNYISLQVNWNWLAAVGVSNKESTSVQAVYRLTKGCSVWVKCVYDNVKFWDATFSMALLHAE